MNVIHLSQAIALNFDKKSTFLCLVYSRKLNFPPTRSRLYNKALDILLEEWAAEKRVQQEEIYQGLHTG
jgi:hypothetical protein